jgi:hypothetical protein
MLGKTKTDNSHKTKKNCPALVQKEVILWISLMEEAKPSEARVF